MILARTPLSGGSSCLVGSARSLAALALADDRGSYARVGVAFACVVPLSSPLVLSSSRSPIRRRYDTFLTTVTVIVAQTPLSGGSSCLVGSARSLAALAVADDRGSYAHVGVAFACVGPLSSPLVLSSSQSPMRRQV